MRVLVTGANGFLGRHLVARLAAGGADVSAIALERGVLADELPFSPVDVRDRDAVAAAVRRFEPEAIVHLAALAHVGESWRRIPEYFEVNVVGTENVLAAAIGRRVVFSSSAEVYGIVPDAEQPIHEERPASPRSPYALTKAAAERLALAAGAIVARCFNLIGPGQAPGFALPSFANQLAAIARGATPVLRVGNLEAKRDFVDVRDAADGLATLLERGAPGAIYNVASGEARSIREALDRLCAVAGLAPTIELDPERMRPVDVPRLAGDASRLRGLGWCCRRPFDETLGDLWREARSA